MLRSLLLGALAGLATGYLVHSTQGAIKDTLIVKSFTVSGATLDWSWTAAIVVTLVGWLIDRAVKT